MSVIGKMQVRAAEAYDKGQKVVLGVVCVDSFMAHYHPENEDVSFTRYSPSGEGTLHFDTPVDFPTVPGVWTDNAGDHPFEKPCELYLIYQQQDERPDIEGATFYAKLKIASVTEYGSDYRTFELCTPYPHSNQKFEANEARLANLKLGVDNPAVSKQFIPGSDGWWVVAYRCDQMTMDEALAHARA